MEERDIDATPVPKFTDEDIALLHGAGQISPIERADVKGTVVTFTVTELKLQNDTPQGEKNRRKTNTMAMLGQRRDDLRGRDRIHSLKREPRTTPPWRQRSVHRFGNVFLPGGFL